MSNLEPSIANWRREVASATNLKPQMLDELENHLREAAQEFIEEGVPEPQAFERAVAQLGNPAAVAAEFLKLQRPVWWPAKIATASLRMLIGLALLALCTAPLRHHVTPVGAILALHVCAVTIGYSAALLVGTLGVCFVCQQSIAEFSTRRLESIRETSFRLTRLALYLTVIGTGLGMIWTKYSWGRFWGWDLKEVGGLGNIVWLAGYLAAHRLGQIPTRALLAGSMITSVIVNLAWFGANQFPSIHAYGWAGAPWFFATVALNLVFVPLGFAPPGWLRSHRA